jgi:hypothetical protein
MRHTSQQTSAGALAFELLNSMRASTYAVPAPSSCAAMKAGASVGRIPEKVLLSERATVIAGLANEVEAVNQ